MGHLVDLSSPRPPELRRGGSEISRLRGSRRIPGVRRGRPLLDSFPAGERISSPRDFLQGHWQRFRLYLKCGLEKPTRKKNILSTQTQTRVRRARWFVGVAGTFSRSEVRMCTIPAWWCARWLLSSRFGSLERAGLAKKGREASPNYF